MAFKDITIKSLKPKETRFEKWEGGSRGFGIRVYPSGTKAWVYRYRINDKRKNIILGKYPGMTLKDARIEHGEKEKLVHGGIDPSGLKQQQRQHEIEAPTVKKLVDRYLKKPTDKKNRPLRPKTVKEYTRLLENDLLPAIGWMKVKDVKRVHIRNAIEKVEERAGNAARQLFKVTRRLFNYAVAKDILETSPMTGMEIMGSEGEKDRNLSPDEIKVFWQGLAKANISEDIKRALKLILVTAQRPGEVIGAHNSEINGDWWTIPKERSKNKKEHTVYLPSLAKELFELDKHDEYLFPTRLKEQDKPIAVGALSKALRRALTGRETGNQEKIDPSIALDAFTPHDLRRTAATQIAKSGFGLYVDKILNHTDQRVTAIYDQYDYAKEKQSALEAWGKKLASIILSKQVVKKPSKQKAIKATQQSDQMNLF